MKKINIYISTIFCFIALVGVGQMKKAEKHFSKFNYAKAIPAYEKVSKGKSNDKQVALIKLADCYRILNNYTKAESYYAQALSMGKVPTEVNYNYGNVLKSNNKYSEALSQYYVYLEDNEKSVTAKNAIKSFQEIKYW
jgi:tetratricopeptide (TPR) repeat protein